MTRTRLEWHSTTAGHTLVVLPGVPGSPADWTGFAGLAARSGLAVAVAHLAGFGEPAEALDYDDLRFDAQADHLADSLAAEAGRPVTLLAHDIGVPVAAILAGRHPDLVCGLVAVAGNVLTDPPLAPPVRALRVPWLRPTARRLLFSDPSLRFMARTRRGAPAASWRSRARAESMAVLFENALRAPATTFAEAEASWRSVAVPALYVAGTRDPFFRPGHARRTAGLRGEQPLLLPRVGHHPHLDAPHDLLVATHTVIGSRSVAG